MPKNPKVLDLDTLFNSAQPIIVRLGGQDFNMVRPIDLTPEQLHNFEKLSDKMTTLGKLEKEPGEYSTEDADFVEEILNDLITTVCPELPVSQLPFMAKVYIITNYQDELAADGTADEIKKGMEPSKKTAGK